MLTGCSSILIHPAPPDDGSDCVIVANGIGHALQHHDANAFAAAVSVGSLVKCKAFAVRTQKVESGHGHDGIGRHDHPCTRGKGLAQKG